MLNRPTPTRPFFSKPNAVCAVLIGATVLAGGTAFAVTDPAPPGKPAAPSAAPQLKVEHDPVDRCHAPAGSFAPIVQKVAPSVVEVFVTSRGGRQQQLLSGDERDLFQRFFGRQGRSAPGSQDDSFAPRQHGLGSGGIVSTDGYILTNNHVVKDATEIRVALADGREFAAKLIGADAKTDVAVVKIQADKLPAMTFADSA